MATEGVNTGENKEELISQLETMTNEIKNGDIWDIGQTVNGVSKFLWFNNKWYYFNESRFSYLDEYQYDKECLTKLITRDEFDEVQLVANIWDPIKL